MATSPRCSEDSAVEVRGRQRQWVLGLVLFCGVLICLWRLGATGVTDETPPLFAAAGRGMVDSGDWLTPRVNGLPRYDKPPLIYWLMALGYALPGASLWDPLGSWAARLPSALSSLVMMLALADTLLRWPRRDDPRPVWTATAGALCFALSPLVLVWSRTAVSDALLCALLGLSLLFQWRRFADPQQTRWWIAWVLLGLAVLAKGPVAVVLTGLTLLLFSALRRDLRTPWRRLRPLPGLLITALISLPWYAAELLVEGQPFWDSFFGYHNLQRFTSVVNDHLQPWWFFGPVMLIAALPFSPLLLLSLAEQPRERPEPDQSLAQFAWCWLLAVLLLFTSAATKLPSYWLPATPASALLITAALNSRGQASGRGRTIAWTSTGLLTLVLAAGFWGSSLWIPLINDPEMPTLSVDLLASGFVLRAAVWFTLAGVLCVVFWRRSGTVRLLAMQASLVMFHLTALIPIAELGDQLRQRPVRDAAEQMTRQRNPGEPLAMVGAMKPSLHFHTGEVVVYEGRSEGALVNLSDRLAHERRRGWRGLPLSEADASSTVLVLIDAGTARQNHWRDLQPQVLGEFGIYALWRRERGRLEARAGELQVEGVEPDWRDPRPERF